MRSGGGVGGGNVKRGEGENMIEMHLINQKANDRTFKTDTHIPIYPSLHPNSVYLTNCGVIKYDYRMKIIWTKLVSSGLEEM